MVGVIENHPAYAFPSYTMEKIVAKKDGMREQLEAMELSELHAHVKMANEVLEAKRLVEKDDAKRRVQEMADMLGYSSIAEMLDIRQYTNGVTRKRGDGTRTPAKAKYKLPDGSEWSGKGRLPLSLRAALDGAAGYDPDEAKFESKEARDEALKKFLI